MYGCRYVCVRMYLRAYVWMHVPIDGATSRVLRTWWKSLHTLTVSKEVAAWTRTIHVTRQHRFNLSAIGPSTCCWHLQWVFLHLTLLLPEGETLHENERPTGDSWLSINDVKPMRSLPGCLSACLSPWLSVSLPVGLFLCMSVRLSVLEAICSAVGLFPVPAEGSRLTSA